MKNPALEQALQYVTQERQRFVSELSDFLRIPSISTDPKFAGECQRAAEWVHAQFVQMGLEARIIPTQRHPLVYAEWLKAGADKPTVLIYGHYDVQPAALAEGWDNEPFEPVIKDGVIYARGATDDKGQFFTHLKAVEALLKTVGALPVNVKFIIEGEEESGGENLARFVKEHGQQLQATACVISDSSMASVDTPVIVYGLRGIVGFEVVAKGPASDLHSGMYGGTVHNPIQALAEIIAQLHDSDGRVTVEGFYDDVLPITPSERNALSKSDYSFEQWQHETGAPVAWGEQAYSLSERIGVRPTLEINGFGGGYHNDGIKAVIPSQAVAKISCRLVANQDPARIYELVKAHIEKLAPPSISLTFRHFVGANPALVDIEHPTMRAAIRAYERGWGATPVFKREGGSLPVVADLQTHLQMPVLLMGFGLNTDNLHAPNERYSLEMFHKGIITSLHFLEEMANL
jgi:acetylornithine deacetylase/succinyl-diaminopimelate desuccinylase-like protein